MAQNSPRGRCFFALSWRKRTPAAWRAAAIVSPSYPVSSRPSKVKATCLPFSNVKIGWSFVLSIYAS